MLQRRSMESLEERHARLQRARVSQQERLAAEKEDERRARLQQLRFNQQEHLAAETEDERCVFVCVCMCVYINACVLLLPFVGSLPLC